MTAIKSAAKQRTFSSTHNKTHQKSNKNRFSPLDFTVAGPSTVVKISSNPVDLQPFDLEDLIIDEEAEEWIVQNRGKHKQTLDTIAEEPEGMLQFTKEEVKVEMDFWKHSVVCFILGANPPWDVVEDFIHHLWADYGVERVSFLPSGIFLVRFKSAKGQETVLKQGHYLFENKPLILKPWSPDETLTKNDVDVVPVWVKLHKLPLKFWSKCIPKITGLLGDFVKEM